MIGGTFYNNSGLMIGISLKKMEEKNLEVLLQVLLEIYGVEIPKTVLSEFSPENKSRIVWELEYLKMAEAIS